MKRHGQDSTYPPPKRHQHDRYHDNHTNSSPHHMQSGQHSAQYSDPQKQYPDISQFYANPISKLESALQSFATQPDRTKEVLGIEIQTQMQTLARLISAWRRAQSPEIRFPSTYVPPKVNLYPKGILGPFDESPVPYRTFLLPDLPEIKDGPLKHVPFIHSSAASADPITGAPLQSNSRHRLPPTGEIESKQHMPWRRSGQGLDVAGPEEVNYERIEFLGDGYIDSIAKELIFFRFRNFSAGRMTALKTTMVTNDTLMTFARAYRFDERIIMGGMDRRVGVSKGNKGFNKVCADVFEAYVAALILSDPEHGREIATTWLYQLWMPILIKAQGLHNSQQIAGLGPVFHDGTFTRPPEPQATAPDPGSPDAQPTTTSVQPTSPAVPKTAQPSILDAAVAAVKTFISTHPSTSSSPSTQALSLPYSHDAKAVLQKRIAPHDVLLHYRDIDPSSSSILSPGTSTAPPPRATFHTAVHLTGWGYTQHLLGRGWGETKTEAGNRAAMDAMVSSRDVVEECERKFGEARREAKREKKARQAEKRALTAEAGREAKDGSAGPA